MRVILLNNSEYWGKRIANNTWRIYNSLEEKNIALLEMYQEASLEIKNELYRLVEKINKGKEPTRSDFYKFNRLTNLNKNFEEIIKGLTLDIEQFYIESNLEGIANVYNNIMLTMEVDDFSLPNKKAMEKMLNTSWEGRNFSESLWENSQKLAMNLNDILVNGITQGKTITEMAVQLNNEMNKGFNVCHRLVRTETMHTLNESAFRGYADAGCKKVQYWAAEDERVCERCGPKHGEKYDIDKRPILPLHANCRCTYLPVIEGSEK